MLPGEPEPRTDPTPLPSILAGTGTVVEVLRLVNGRFILEAESDDAALRIDVPSVRTFGSRDGIIP